MKYAMISHRQAKLLLIAFVGSLFFCEAATPASAQSCAVGARVEVEMVDNAVGVITEIGTVYPHVGWYRIVYDWNVRGGNPKGDWYSPKNREIRIAGTRTRCGSAAATNTQPQAKNNTTVTATEDQTLARGECPMNELPGRVTRSSAASAQLFKRVIYENMAAKVNDGAISAPKKVGLTFLEFSMGKAYKNTLTANRPGDRRLHDGAPVGAMIHPVKTKYLRCDLYDREISGSVRQAAYACFKNRFGDWVCPVDGVSKTLERKSISLR